MKDEKVIDAIDPKIETVCLSVGKVEIGPIKIKNLVRLFAHIKDFQAVISDPKNEVQSTIEIINSLGDKIGDILPLVIGSEINCDDLTLHDISVLAAAIVKVNDFEAIKSNFKVATGKK